jgi:hypothetical protein
MGLYRFNPASPATARDAKARKLLINDIVVPLVENSKVVSVVKGVERGADPIMGLVSGAVRLPHARKNMMILYRWRYG